MNRWLILAAMMLLLVFLGTVLDGWKSSCSRCLSSLPIVRLLGFDKSVWRAVRRGHPDRLHQPVSATRCSQSRGRCPATSA